ncbi:DUF922 domain-containing protein [Christiangramia forsetii]|uniref:Secreted protein n=2 Tax=Christiangramia forsetii TaxID=411153 RepID=A0M3J5_CHRFK|nr:DUF922 domain-containing protein [Christiangramia forsetii]GGG25711.1 hypothetical protein GCM10011532_06310 [Christiangramia forsetii]CAL67190.1 secreted protein [Christiangramia forsetii KT0803]
MKSLGSLLFFLVIPMITFSQEKQEKIQWQEGLPLNWNDFKAQPDKSNSFSANTNSGISYSWSYSTASGVPVLKHEVFTNFYPNLSWVKDIKNEEYLLAHEQLHFDISELHARKLRKALDDYEIGRNIRQDLKRLYNRIESERVAMQNQFDKETSHSENSSAEMRWRKFVADELEKFKAYTL